MTHMNMNINNTLDAEYQNKQTKQNVFEKMEHAR